MPYRGVRNILPSVPLQPSTPGIPGAPGFPVIPGNPPIPICWHLYTWIQLINSVKLCFMNNHIFALFFFSSHDYFDALGKIST